MKFFAHPFWLVGFRPFFALASLSGIVLPLLWVLIFRGKLPPPTTAISAIQWHAHEMFYGFGWAVIGGFLLTSTKNWVGVRGYHGGALIFLAAAWLFERLGMACLDTWPPLLFRLSNNLFLAAIVVMLLRTLLVHRGNDSFRDNYFFYLILPLFLVAKNLLLVADSFPLGVAMSLGLFRLAFLVMLERTLTQFMKGVFQVEIRRYPRLDGAIKFGALVLVFSGWLPPPGAAVLAVLVALLLAWRLRGWHPELGLTRLDVGIMHLGYMGIIVQLLLEAWQALAAPVWVGTVAVHAFTFGVMGLIAPAMLMRIAKGHTGRKVVFDRLDKACLWAMLLALVLRVVLPQVVPAIYLHLLDSAALCWAVCFGIYAWRYIPVLMQVRVDGKEH